MDARAYPLEAVRDRREIVREEQWMRLRILRELEGGAMTVPELAESLGRPPSEVVFWVMGLRKYGFIHEVKESEDDGYFRYRAAEKVT
jgi:predicted transcriptional regulator